MDSTFDTSTITQARGSAVYSSDGQKIGTVEEIYTDIDTDQPE